MGMVLCNDDPETPFLRDIPIGLILSLITPFVLLLAFSFPTHVDLVWAMNSTRSLANLPLLTDSTVITIERSACYGWCPAYTLQLWGSGKVEYNGRAWVCERGTHTASVDPREVSRLVQAMVATGYFGYSWKKGNFATDNPTVITSLQHQGRRYRLCHYHGDLGAPWWLRAMEDEIDRVAGTQRWLPVVGNPGLPLCATPGGGTRPLPMDD